MIFDLFSIKVDNYSNEIVILPPTMPHLSKKAQYQSTSVSMKDLKTMRKRRRRRSALNSVTATDKWRIVYMYTTCLTDMPWR